jgi:hypothetical protein
VKNFRWDALWKATLRLAGLAIILNEAVLSEAPGERPFLYVAALAMMGITVTIPADQKRRNGDQ